MLAKALIRELMGAIILGILTLAMFGCNSNNPSKHENDASKTDIMIRGYGQMPSIASEEGKITLWTAGAADRIRTVMQAEPVLTQISQLQALGFQVSYENCCIIEGQAYPPDCDTLVSVEITAISLAFPGDTTLGAFITRASNLNVGWVVQSQILSSTMREGYEYSDLGEHGLWWYGYAPVYSMNLYPNFSSASKMLKFSFKSWLKCSVEVAIAGCAAAGAGCAMSPPTFVPCFVLWCGGSAIGGMAGCALHQLWGSD